MILQSGQNQQQSMEPSSSATKRLLVQPQCHPHVHGSIFDLHSRLSKAQKNRTKNVQVTWAVVSSWRSQFEDLGAKWNICQLEKLRSQPAAIHRKSIKDVKRGNADGSRKALDRTQWCHKLAFHCGLFTAFDKQPLNFYWPSKKLTRTFNPTSKKYQWCQAMFHTQWGRQ